MNCALWAPCLAYMLSVFENLSPVHQCMSASEEASRIYWDGSLGSESSCFVQTRAQVGWPAAREHARRRSPLRRAMLLLLLSACGCPGARAAATQLLHSDTLLYLELPPFIFDRHPSLPHSSNASGGPPPPPASAPARRSPEHAGAASPSRAGSLRSASPGHEAPERSPDHAGAPHQIA